MSTKNIPSGSTAGTFAAGDDPRFALATADASAANKGLIQLSGDLGGTAAAPYILGGSALAYNYVPNPSFETDYTNWTLYGTYSTITRSNVTSKFGSYSSGQVNSTALDGGVQSVGIPLAVGTYTFSVYAKLSPGVTNASMIVRVVGSQTIAVKINQSYVDSNWNQYSTNFVVSSPQTYEILLGIGSYGSMSTGTVYYDAVSIQSGLSAAPYFDGNTVVPGETYTWTGLANTSYSSKQARARLQNTDQLIEGTTNQYFTTARAWTNPTFTGTVSGITKTAVGLTNVDNTSVANKPVSTAQQTAINAVYNADPSLDYGLLAVNVDPAFCNGSETQSSGRSTVSKLRVAVSGTVGSVVFYVNTAPTSITGAQVAVYASDGSRLGLVADATSAYAATKNRSVPITLSRGVVKGEILYIATIVLYGAGSLAVSAPQSQPSELVNFGLSYTAANYGRSVYQNGQTALPATFDFTDTSWGWNNYNRLIGLHA